MKISAGAPGWYDACSPAERAATVALAATRRKWSVLWSAAAATGVVLACYPAAAGLLPLPGPEPAAPPGALSFAIGALLLDLAVLVVNSVAWGRVERVFSGVAPDEVVRPFRWVRWLPTSLVSLLGTVAMLVVGVYPLALYGETGLRGLSAADWASAGVAVLCVLCGLSTLWLKVILRPVRTGP
ncbi:hypothetical protein ACH474_09940 [Nocardia rhamnosiphila]|uniref:hypothetical protein n=1 Tax=Nocardia rhamnosiphila TaxID=426716 RepID=UPI0004C2D002|nr:hypothetical protein [Nocardia rhamnosiphila]